MYNLQNQLSVILNEKEIYSCVANALMGEIDADYIYMLMYDPKKDIFIPCYGQDAAGKGISASRNPISTSVLIYVKRRVRRFSQLTRQTTYDLPLTLSRF